MRKKELAALPVMTTKSKKRLFGVRVNGDTLVLDGWDEGEYRGRYCLRDNGEYMVLVDGIWRQQRLSDMLSQSTHYWWSDYGKDGKCFDKEQEKVCREFLDKMDGYDGGRLETYIGNVEYRANNDKRERAARRKHERIQQRMAVVPALPDGFEEWCKAVPFGGRQYMFSGHREGEYFCTACGKTHKSKTAKQNRTIICSRTGRPVKVDKRLATHSETCYTMVLQWMTTGERVARHFKLESVWTPKGQRISAYEQVRYVLKSTGCNEWYYGRYYKADACDQEWCEKNPHSFHCFQEFCYPEGVRDILAGTVYEHLGIPEMAHAGWRVWYNKLMICCHTAKCYEYLAKGGYQRLVEDLSSYPTYRLHQGNTLQEVLRIDKQRANRLRQAGGGGIYLEWLRWEKETARKIPEVTIRWLENNHLTESDVHFILDRMSPEQVANYLTRQRQLHKKSVHWLMGEWKDALRMAGQLKQNVQDPIVYRPKDLVAAHDRLVLRLNQKAAKEQEREYEKRFPGIRKVCRSLAKYEWSDGEYTVIAPKSVSDILAEGRHLNHCGTSERYFERIAMNMSYILFLRRAEKPDVPWYTLEVEPGGVIRQKRTHYNRQENDLKPAMDFLRRWQKEIQKRLKAEDKTRQEKSAAARKQELDQLRRDGVVVHGGELTGTLLADVLLADLMEIPA